MKENRRCLYCYQPLRTEKESSTYHTACSKSIFGTNIPPLLEYTNDEMLLLAEQIIKNQTTVTGVQPKLSLGIQKVNNQPAPTKLTIIGVLGNYILKPPTTDYAHLPELEDVTMHLAAIAGIQTVPHTLIPLASGELAYLTKRIDRVPPDGKLHLEDMCQLTEKLTEAKYRGSYEQIAKVILRHSIYPGLDVINFFEQVVFSFLTGNNDMHLKNFSLFRSSDKGYHLSPAYDLVASQLVVEGDNEELALHLNGKKKKIKRRDFEIAMKNSTLPSASINNLFKRLKKALPKWHSFIEQSFLPNNMKVEYQTMIAAKAQQIEL